MVPAITLCIWKTPTSRFRTPKSITLVRDAVRESTGQDVAAVLISKEFPTDIRHNSKIDRPRLARWATRVLSGGKVGTP